MSNHEFDIFARHLGMATSRRGIGRVGPAVLGAAVLARLGLSAPDVFAAKSGRCKTPCGECQQCNKGACRKTRHGKKRCKRGRCTPKENFTNCEFGGFCLDGECRPN